MRKNHAIWLCLLAILSLGLPGSASAQISVGVSIHIGPPALPVYAQPICPGPGHIWTPGYWAYGPDGYYWVPGTWVLAPTPGLLWTPGYWGWAGGVYVWRGGYWGPHVGFYGGVNYGFGYGGVGFVGGRWEHGVFAYNSAVTHVDTTVIHNTYINKTVVNNTTVNRTSYNGGTGGTTAQPTATEKAAENEKHTPATSEQTQHEHAASTNRSLLASENHGHPAVAATSKPGEFKGQGVESAKTANSNASRNAAAKGDTAAAKNGNAHNASAGKSAAAGKRAGAGKGSGNANKASKKDAQGNSESQAKKPASHATKPKPEHSHGG
jgi:hypothetical protein